MPIYEFQCGDCGHKSEVLVRSADEKVACAACGGERLVRLLSTFSAHGGEKAPAHAGGGCSCCPASPTCPSSKGGL